MAKGKQRTNSKSESASAHSSTDKTSKKGNKTSNKSSGETSRLKVKNLKRTAEMTKQSAVSSETNGESFNSELEMLRKLKQQERKERESIVLWRRPFTTLQYFIYELALEAKEYTIKLWQYKVSVLLFTTVLLAGFIAYHFPGSHQAYVQTIEKQIIWCLYWLGLGVLSSVGLGTGLHTFLLYLGPHIAAVTLAAYECGSLDFPSPPYPDSIICPDDETQNKTAVTIWSIMSKVRLEAMMWGAGTALGELPPYFMARAARLSALGGSGRKGRRRSSIELAEAEDLEKIAEFEELQRKQEHPEEMTWMDRAKLTVERLVERVGFFGILACASIPNPLFDLAGITCGHFLVPFWTFFGATLIGKAIIKTHLQQLTVIVAFNENLVESAVAALAKVPGIGARLTQPVEQLLQSQKAKLHSKAGKEPVEGGSLLASLFEKLVLAMVAYFVLSIVNSLAQSYHRRLYKQKQMVQLMSQPAQTADGTSRSARRRSNAPAGKSNQKRS